MKTPALKLILALLGAGLAIVGVAVAVAEHSNATKGK